MCMCIYIYIYIYIHVSWQVVHMMRRHAYMCTHTCARMHAISTPIS